MRKEKFNSGSDCNNIIGQHVVIVIEFFLDLYMRIVGKVNTYLQHVNGASLYLNYRLTTTLSVRLLLKI